MVDSSQEQAIAPTAALNTWPDLLGLAGLTLILILAAYLRLANITDSPGWYTDEGTHLAIAGQLAQGRTQYLAITQSTLLFAKLPLFELLLAALLKLAGGGMGTLRALSAILGLISIVVLYGVVWWIKRDAWLALSAALLLAIYPQAVLYNRFGFSYNLLAPLTLLTLLGLWQYWPTPTQAGHSRAWLALAALVIGLGGLSDLWMFLLAPLLLLATLVRRWRDVVWSLILVLAPFGLYTAYMLLTAPAAFLFDLHFTATRLSSLTLAEQISKLATNYTVLTTQDPWLALAIVGLFLLRPLRLQLLAFLLLGMPILLLGRREALYQLSFYYMVPLLPLICLGLAVLLRQGIPYAAHNLGRALAELFRSWLPDRLLLITAYLAVLSLATTPFLATTLKLIRQTHDGFTTAIDPFLIEPQFARYAARYINEQVVAGDVVIASPGIAWMLRANTADFQMALAFNGQATPHLPANIPPERFAFKPDYRQARFVVVDNLWHTWAVFNVGGVAGMLETVERWPVAFQSGNITVYCNPARAEC